MGNLATPEALILRWDEVLRDPSLQDLPYKIGMVLTECSILTRIGIRVPDVAWASEGFMDVEAEIVEKTSAYLAAGAKEVWLVSEDGRIRYLGPSGEKPNSDFPVAVTLPQPLPGKP